jgi:tetratricopeptide (TPR) repeat protein
LERALAAVGTDDSRERVGLLARLAAASRDDADRDRRVALANEAVEIAERIGDPVTLAHALEGHWIAAEGPAELSHGIEVAKQVISLGERIGDKERVFAGHDFLVHLHWTRADRVAVDVLLDSAKELADELRQPAQRWWVGTAQTMLAIMEGRFEQAEQLIAQTLAMGERALSWNAQVSYRLQLFALRRAQGRLADLEEMVARSVHEYPTLLRFRCALGHLYAELGRERDARAVLDDLLARDLAREHVDAEWLFSMSLLPDPVARLSGDDGAAKLYSVLLPYEELYAQAPVEATFGCLARGLGLLATKLRRFDDAERHLELAAEVESRMRARPWLAHVKHDLARMVRARGDDDLATETAAEAAAAYRELGMESWAARASAT